MAGTGFMSGISPMSLMTAGELTPTIFAASALPQSWLCPLGGCGWREGEGSRVRDAIVAIAIAPDKPT
jgi:hypothetical protein